jgi:hypothetical protein
MAYCNGGESLRFSSDVIKPTWSTDSQPEPWMSGEVPAPALTMMGFSLSM